MSSTSFPEILSLFKIPTNVKPADTSDVVSPIVAVGASDKKLKNHLEYYKSVVEISMLPDGAQLKKILTTSPQDAFKWNAKDGTIVWQPHDKGFLIDCNSKEMWGFLRNHLANKAGVLSTQKNVSIWKASAATNTGKNYQEVTAYSLWLAAAKDRPELAHRDIFTDNFNIYNKLLALFPLTNKGAGKSNSQTKQLEDSIKNSSVDNLNASNVAQLFQWLVKCSKAVKVLEEIIEGSPDQQKWCESLLPLKTILDDVLLMENYITVGEYKCEEKASDKSYPIVLRCHVSLLHLHHKKILLIPKDIPKVQRNNLFVKATEEQKDEQEASGKTFAQKSDLSMEMSQFEKMIETFGKDDDSEQKNSAVFHEDFISNTNNWNKAIDFLVRNMRNYQKYTLQPRLIFVSAVDEIRCLYDAFKTAVRTVSKNPGQNNLLQKCLAANIAVPETTSFDQQAHDVYTSNNDFAGYLKENKIVHAEYFQHNKNDFLKVESSGADFDHFGLNQHQRIFAHHASKMPQNGSENVIALNGPPGTGKTTVLQTVIASMVVNSTLESQELPVIFGCSATNQAKNNIIGGFAYDEVHPKYNVDKTLYQRWVYATENVDGKLVCKSVDYGLALENSALSNLATNLYENANNLAVNYCAKYENYANTDKLSASQISASDFLSNLWGGFNSVKGWSEQPSQLVSNAFNWKSLGNSALLSVGIPPELCQQLISALAGSPQQRISACVQNLQQDLQKLHGIFLQTTQQKARWFAELLEVKRSVEDLTNHQLSCAHNYQELQDQLEKSKHNAYVNQTQQIKLEQDIRDLDANFAEEKDKIEAQWGLAACEKRYKKGARHWSSFVEKYYKSRSWLNRLKRMIGLQHVCINRTFHQYEIMLDSTYLTEYVDHFTNQVGADVYSNQFTAENASYLKKERMRAIYLAQYNTLTSVLEDDYRKNLQSFEDQQNVLNNNKDKLIEERREIEENITEWNYCQLSYSNLSASALYLLQQVQGVLNVLSYAPITQQRMQAVEQRLKTHMPQQSVNGWVLPHGFEIKDVIQHAVDELIDCTSVLVDNVFKPTMFHLSARIQEGLFINKMLDLDEKSFKKYFLYSFENSVSLRYSWMAKICPVFVSTFHSLARNVNFKDKGLEYANIGFIDVLVVDEAGQASPELAAMGLLLSKKSIVVGDAYQIAPVYNMDASLDWGLFRAKTQQKCSLEDFDKNPWNCHQSSILRVAQQYTKWHQYPDLERGLYLVEHNRCPVEVIQFCDQLIYKNNLRYSITSLYTQEASNIYSLKYANQLKQNGSLDKCSVNFIRNSKILPAHQNLYFGDQKPFELISHGGDCTKGVRCNPKEIETILQWIDGKVTKIEQSCQKQNKSMQLNKILAIITPFKRQADEIRKQGKLHTYNNLYLEQNKNALFSPKGPNNKDGLIIGTVHSLQGAEIPIVLFSNVYGSQDTLVQPFIDRQPEILNVAVSRAKQSFYVFANQSYWNAKAANGTGATGMLAQHIQQYTI